MSLPADLKDPYDKILSVVTREHASEVVKPFWAKDEEDEECTLEWLRDAISATEMNTLIRMERALLNRFACRNIQWVADEKYGLTNKRRDTSEADKISIPDQKRYRQNFVSRLLRFKAGTLPTPTTNEFADKQGARVAKLALTSIHEQFDFEALDMKMVRRLPTDGEAFMFITWDKNAGALTEQYKKAREKLGNKKGRVGSYEFDPKKPERIGDFVIDIPEPWLIFIDPNATCPKEAQWVLRIKFRHIEDIVNDYPEKESAIREKALSGDLGQVRNVDTSSAQEIQDSDMLPVVYFYHRAHKNLPFGKYIVSLAGVLLEDEDNPYSNIEILQYNPWGDLPLESLTDVDVEGHIRGYPSISEMASPVRARNQILTSINRNMLLYGSPKLFVHDDCEISIEALRSGTAIVKWSGSQVPELKQMGAIPPEMVQFHAVLGTEIERGMNMHPISSGEPPKGITAGVALRLLKDKEDELYIEHIKKLNNFVVFRDRRLLALMGHFYKKEDGRMIHIVGEDNTDLIEKLDIQALTRPYNVRLEPVAPDSQSAAARKQDVLDLLQYGPENVLTKEQIVDALELNRPEKVTDPAQAAVTSAERVIQLCAQGKDFPMPRVGENYLVKWKIFMTYYQRPGFESLPEPQKDKFVEMITVLEFLMDEQALKNPAYEQVLLTVPQWPAFYTPSPRGMPLPAPGAEMAPAEADPSMMNPEAAFSPQPPITNDQLVS